MLAHLLNNKFKEERGVSLTQKISENEFIVLVNQMLSAKEIVQIKHFLSVTQQTITEMAALAVQAMASTTSSSNNSAQPISLKQS